MDHQEHDENQQQEREIPAAEKLRKLITKETEMEFIKIYC